MIKKRDFVVQPLAKHLSVQVASRPYQYQNAFIIKTTNNTNVRRGCRVYAITKQT